MTRGAWLLPTNLILRQTGPPQSCKTLKTDLSYLQVQDSSLQTAGKIVDRMAELRVMAQDITKNTSDIENYSKEFVELQSQLNQISKEKFNGISLFASSNALQSLESGTASFNYII